MNNGHPVNDIITAVSGIITVATVQQMIIWSTLNRALVVFFITLNFRKFADTKQHPFWCRFSNLHSVSTDQTCGTNMSKKDLACEYLKMFSYVSFCVYMSLCIHTQREKVTNRPRIQLQENVHPEKATSGAQVRRKHYWKRCYSEAIEKRGILSIWSSSCGNSQAGLKPSNVFLYKAVYKAQETSYSS